METRTKRKGNREGGKEIKREVRTKSKRQEGEKREKK